EPRTGPLQPREVDGRRYLPMPKGSPPMTVESVPVEPRYWLMVGDVPAGPFPAADVRAKLASGEATGHTRACLLGECVWRPLIEMAEFGPPPASAADGVRPGCRDEGVPSRLPSTMARGCPWVMAALTACWTYASKERPTMGPGARVGHAVISGWVGMLFGYA